MPNPGSITVHLKSLRAGDEAAVEKLWAEYFRRLVGLARKRLVGRPAGPTGSEDVALSALNAFYRGAKADGFARLDGRDDLWDVLMMLTVRKAEKAVRRERARKRGGGKVVAAGLSFEEVFGDEPSPAAVAEMAELCLGLFDRLPADDLRRIAGWKMENRTNQEIADELGVVVSTVERKLKLIRKTWAGHDRPGPPAAAPPPVQP